MSKPRLLDAFSGAGGAAMGYARAGFDVTGIDIKPQPRYPFAFIQGDALAFIREHGHEYDAIHASPPCQRYAATQNLGWRDHPDLIDPTRGAVVATGKPYVIENVPGAPLRDAVMLCGAQFGLKVYRHRLFECSFPLLVPPHAPHRDQTPASNRGISPKGFISVAGNINNTAYVRFAMGIDWMTGNELAQAIPPLYTEHIGRALLAHLAAQSAVPPTLAGRAGGEKGAAA